ncbi:aminotransferase class V-fold PLP-dependent enzyme [Halanaerobium sp. Z-7514]|uniref:Aminotransferase class V-fold PLP-dependent enzyme n=1 Tax=Halanaerobium polyolivorans TaxID=2886943 RepID=A0AAW4X149_9FIRM|nr:GntG family PLP-dependent aldolase [Halanaerobium polyolivorans]MCC3145508.1 aminotransferase class V-fold PLP-dependent enzyme [Halanaerobium polyolivorans]
MEIKVDLFSDTGTRPSQDMRRFMAEAEVGDEQLGEDPSVNRLCRMAAEMMGKDEAIYLPSGLMANQISYAVHTKAGDEIIMDQTAHPIHYEAGAVAVISGASIKALAGEGGIFTADDLKAAIRGYDYHSPQTRVVSIEQTTNLGGGRIWPLERIAEIAKIAADNGLKMHMDGARMLNAAIAAGVEPLDYGQYFDSIWLDLSKGLGAPVGSVLAGSAEFIEKARFWKQRLGGAMRQAGIIAAGGIFALEHNVSRLKEDHEHAKMLAKTIDAQPGLEIDPDTVETNIVLFSVKDNKTELFADELLKEGIRVSRLNGKLRAVTHLDVNRDDIRFAVKNIEKIANQIFG